MSEEKIKSHVLTLLPTLPDAMIAREVGCSRERVRQIRERAEVLSDCKYLRCNRVFNEDRLVEIAELNKTMSVGKIAKMYKTSETLVRKLLTEYVGKVHTFYPRKVDRQAIRELFEQKLPCTEIARRLNVSLVTVSRYRKEMNEFYPRKVNIQAMTDLLAQGLSNREVARRLNVSHGTVSRYRKDLTNGQKN